MRVTQAVLGVFHHFELARELNRRELLDTIYTTFPWARLKRESLPRSRVAVFPYIHAPQMLMHRYLKHSDRVHAQLDIINRITFDRFVERRTSRVPPPDVFIAISGSVLTSAVKLQQRGSLFVCDRGSTHQVHMERILKEEAIVWGLEPVRFDPVLLQRELDSYQTADAITVPSHASARTFLNEGVPAEKIHVIPYGVRLEQFTKVGDAPAGRFEVLFVGSVTLRKGIPYLLKAFAQVRHPNKRLTIIGSISPDLRQLLPSLPTDNVRLLGPRPQATLIDDMSRSHVLVLPSVEDGFGLVMAQAMACGCPVLASNGTGADDLYTDGVEGFIVPMRQVEPLTQRLQELADNPELQASMGEAALERVQALGGWNNYGDLWESLLRTLTHTRQPV